MREDEGRMREDEGGMREGWGQNEEKRMGRVCLAASPKDCDNLSIAEL